MCRVTDVAGDELVQAFGREAAEERGEPVDDDEDEHDDREEPEPQEVRNRKEEPEEDRESRSPEVVRDDEANRVRLGRGHRSRDYPLGSVRSSSSRAGATSCFHRIVRAMTPSATRPRTTLNAVSAICIPTLKLISRLFSIVSLRNT